MTPFRRTLALRAIATLLIATVGTALVAGGNPPAVGLAGPPQYVDPVPVWFGLVLLAVSLFVISDIVAAARSRSASARAEWMQLDNRSRNS